MKLLLLLIIFHQIFLEKNFSFEKWIDFDEKLWKKIKDKSLDKEIEYSGIISGSDNCTKNHLKFASRTYKIHY